MTLLTAFIIMPLFFIVPFTGIGFAFSFVTHGFAAVHGARYVMLMILRVYILWGAVWAFVALFNMA